MIFCNECGVQLIEKAAFCNSCGAAVQSVGDSRVNSQLQTAPVQKMKKKTKRMLIVAGIAVVVLFSGYKVGEALTDKDRLIEKFEEALVKGDSVKVAKLLNSDDPQLKLNKTSVKGFVTYYKEHPDDRSDLIESLKEQSKFLDQEDGSAKQAFTELFGEDALSNDVVNLGQGGRTAFFFDKFTLNVEAVYLTVRTNYKDTELSLDDTKLGTADKQDFEKTFGPYLPGVYNIQAKLKTDFVDLTKKEEVSLINTGDEANVNLYLDGEDITLEMDSFAPETNAKLLIDGKDVKINPVNEPTFGPVLTDGSMNIQVEAEVPWGKVKTEEIPITSNNVYVNLGRNADLQSLVFNQIVTHTKEVLEAYKARSADKLTGVTKAFKQETQDGINDYYNDDLFYKGQYLSSAFAVDSLDVYYSDGKWLADVEVYQTYLEDHYYEGDTPDLEETGINRRFTLIYDETQKKWLISDVQESYGFDTENIKEIIEEKPKMFQINGESTTTSSEIDSIQISAYVEEYLYASVDAINEEDFSIVESYLDPDGKKYTEQKEYTAYLNEENITEELIDTEITEVKKLDNTTYQVTSNDQYKIIYDDGTENLSNFNTVQKVKVLSDGSLAINELISTKEVE